MNIYCRVSSKGQRDGSTWTRTIIMHALCGTACIRLQIELVSNPFYCMMIKNITHNIADCIGPDIPYWRSVRVFNATS